MIVGTTILRLDGNAYYSPEFGRGGLAANFAVDVMNISLASGNLDITVEHRNSDTATWTQAGAFTSISAVGLATKDVTGLWEIIRLKFVFTGTTAADAAHFLVQAPSWRPY